MKRIKALQQRCSCLLVQLSQLSEIQKKFTCIDETIASISTNFGDNVVTIAFTDDSYEIPLIKLLEIKDNFFYQYIFYFYNKNAIPPNIINVKREAGLFEIILDYFNDRSFYIRNLTKDQITQLQTEVDFYCLTDLKLKLESMLHPIKITKIHNSFSLVNSNNSDDIYTLLSLVDNESSGIEIKKSPFEIVFELDDVYVVNEIDYKRIMCKQYSVFGPLSVFGSVDNIDWIFLGQINTNKKSTMEEIVATKAKFIKIQSNHQFTISRLKIYKQLS